MVGVVILFAVFVVAPLLIIGLISAADPEARQYLRSSTIHKIEPYHWWLQLAIFVSIGVLSCAFWLHSQIIRTALARVPVDAERAESDSKIHRPPSVPDPSQTPVERAIAYYESIGYGRINGFEGKDGEQLILYAREGMSPDAGLWYREAAIIYPDGDSAKISVGVLYESDSWAYNDEFKIQKLRFGMPVKVKTALNRPILEAMAQRNQHLITLGLASMGKDAGEAEENGLERTNNLVAAARGYNLAYAAWELGWKPAENIHPLSLGRAKTPPDEPVFEPLQRTAIIIGVNAPTITVTGRDAVIAAMRLVKPSNVDLGNYARSPQNPGPVGALRPGQGYKSRTEMQVLDDPIPGLVLEPVAEK